LCNEDVSINFIPDISYKIFLLTLSVQKNQEGSKLNGTHKLLVYTEDINLMGESVNTIKEKTQKLY
jgi:hypothetical protein